MQVMQQQWLLMLDSILSSGIEYTEPYINTNGSDMFALSLSFGLLTR